MLRINKTDALIGITTTPAKMNIYQPKADLEITTKNAKLDIHTEQVQIRIDQRQCFNESGLKDFATLTRDNAMEARQAALEGISRRVNEGNMMADVKSGKNVIAEIALNNLVTNHVFDIDTMPKSRPKIDYVGGTVDIRVDEGYVNIKAIPNKPIIDVEAGDVEIYMKQYPDIKFEYAGNELDLKL